MQILFKFIITNIREKKLRTFLIIFAVTVSAALFFASNGISGNMEDIYLKRIMRNFGSAEIMVHSGEKSPSKYFYMNKLESFKSDMEYIIGVNQELGIFKPNRKESISINLQGMGLEELNRMNPIKLSETKDISPFSGEKIIIGKPFAEKYGFKLGEKIELDVKDIKQRFTIVGIAEVSGFFTEESDSVYAVVPQEFLASLFNAKGMYSTIYMKPIHSEKKQELINEISKKYRNYVVEQTVDEQDLKSGIKQMTSSFSLMLSVVILMSVFIIYTAFKVITLERLPVIGTFRSIGATKKMTDLVLILESLAYGSIGGTLGSGLGIGVLYMMLVQSTPDWMRNSNIAIHFNFSDLLSSFLLAVILSFVSAVIPIVRISKISVKDIVLNKLDKADKKKTWKIIFGIICIIASIFIPVFFSQNIPGISLLMDALALTLSIVGIVIFVPYLTLLYAKLLENIYSFIFGNEGILAVKNIKKNKSMLNNIALIAIGISALLMINTISSSVAIEVLNAYAQDTYDAKIFAGGLDKQAESIVQRIQGVSDTYGNYQANNIKIGDGKDRIALLNGVRVDKFLNYDRTSLGKNPEEMLRKLDEGRNIAVTYILKDRLGLKEGQVLDLDMKAGHKQYTIIGFIDSIHWNGSYALISDRYLKLDMQLKYYSNMSVKTSEDPNIVKDRIKKELASRVPFVMTMKEMEEENSKSNAQMFAILQGFSIMAMIIGVFGILNNFLISFMERKRALAVFASVGMSKKQMIKMIFIEALSGGIIGGVVGVTEGALQIFISIYLMKAMQVPIPLHISIKMFVYSVIAGAIITIIASIAPAFKSSKLNIIEAIKYE